MAPHAHANMRRSHMLATRRRRQQQQRPSRTSTTETRRFNTSGGRRASAPNGHPRFVAPSRHSHQTGSSGTASRRTQPKPVAFRGCHSAALATRGSWITTTAPRGRGRWNARSNTTSSSSGAYSMPRSVVLDGLAIGRAGSFTSDGSVSLGNIMSALSYYVGNGARVVAIFPENVLIKSIEKKQTQQLFSSLVRQGLVVIAPCSGESFDCFILRTANKFSADIVSNERFELQLYTQHRRSDRATIGEFLRCHLVPFAFVLSSFVPHPNPNAIPSGLHGPRVEPSFLRKQFANVRRR